MTAPEPRDPSRDGETTGGANRTSEPGHVPGSDGPPDADGRRAKPETASDGSGAASNRTEDRPETGDAPREPDHSGGGGGSVDEAVRDAFEADLAEARRVADENWDRYLRAEADLENVRRRSTKLRDDAVAAARRDMLLSVLDIADNLERALSFSESDPEALADGVEGTYRELTRLLERQGVELIPAMDESFDPALHEAVSVVPWPDARDETVISVDRAGYTIDGDLLRPARVVVGKPVEDGNGGADKHG